MKVNIFLAILFTIVTTFTAVHAVEHIHDGDGEACLISHVNNLTPSDTISTPEIIEPIHFEAIQYNALVVKLHFKQRSNETRAPPSLS